MAAAFEHVVERHKVVDGSLYSLVPTVLVWLTHSRIRCTRSVLDFHVARAVYSHWRPSTNYCHNLSHKVRGDPVTWLLRAALITTAVVSCDRR